MIFKPTKKITMAGSTGKNTIYLLPTASLTFGYFNVILELRFLRLEFDIYFARSGR